MLSALIHSECSYPAMHAQEHAVWSKRRATFGRLRRAREREKRAAGGAVGTDAQKIVRDVVVPEAITVAELANRMAVRGAEVVKVLMKLGIMGNINDVLDHGTAELVVAEFGHRMKKIAESDV